MRSPASRPARLRILAALALLAAGGCSAPRSPLPDAEAALAELRPAYTGEAVLACLATALPAQRACRDRVAQAMLVAIDLRYAEFELAFFDANRGVGFGATVATLGLGAAGSVAGTGTSQVLSAISAAVTGTREAFNREILVEQTAAALLTAMRSQRDIVGRRIRDGLARDADAYPLGIALSDLYAYYRAGTVPGALVGVTEAVGVQRAETQEALRLAVPLARGAAARALQAYVQDPATPEARRAARARLRAEMNRLGLPADLQVTDFINDPDPAREAQHLAIARNLNLGF